MPDKMSLHKGLLTQHSCVDAANRKNRQQANHRKDPADLIGSSSFKNQRSFRSIYPNHIVGP
jgi:hypothetical protein